ncbi:hypothetical protein GCM10011514_10520 [Emticicia aquatilis]|uniref:Uncharacterized protein n=1 Tax=Emticicia aquatilis TaxID=1537369 RepID=A0A917DKS7_9BACT|nr:hypothetical protein [Emticicia aquatilis]GGD48364.1 hypothetical protein GCM10011514_10520 [Emticicia aquatilis]
MENTNELISFGINQIATEQFAIIPEAHKIGEAAQIQHELNFGIDKENKRIYVRKLARFQHPDSSPFLIIAVACHFFIVSEDWAKLQVPDSERIVLPKDLGVHLAMLTVGTLRGVLHAKTENTPFSQYIFPPFDVTSLLPEIVSFD